MADASDNIVSLTLRGSFDEGREAVGLYAEASRAFDDGRNTRAQVEILAAIAAKANCIAAEVIRAWQGDEDSREQLYAHFASLKEQMLNDMLEQIDAHPSGSESPGTHRA